MTDPATDRRRALLRLSALTVLGHTLAACGGGGDATAPVSPAVAPAPPAQPPAGAALQVVTLTSRLSEPWGLAFLPDARMLVTQRSGTMVIVSADGTSVSAPLSGLPPVVAAGQGGLLDVAVDPQFASDPWVYWTYSEAGSGGAGTAVARARLVGQALQDVAVIFRQAPKVGGSGHFGSRLAFRGDGTLFVTLGERQLGTPAQDPMGHLGKVVRIRRDGTVPADNPSFGPGARPELWSMGHRNPQGAAIHPASGDLWLTEHGPQGGDELNHVRAGANHGWPLRSYGCNYGDPVGTACRIGGGVHAPDFVEPVSTWVPTSTAPSGLMFYSGQRFPEWRGHAFTGALAGSTLWRLALDGDRVVEREEVDVVKALGERIRSVHGAPDGWIVMLTDSGKLLRLQR